MEDIKMAEKRKIGNLTVNDGKGLLDNFGLIDSLIVDVNDMVKLICSGQYVAFCQKPVVIVQKLANLRNGIKAEMDDRDAQIADLKRFSDELLKKMDAEEETEETTHE